MIATLIARVIAKMIARLIAGDKASVSLLISEFQEFCSKRWVTYRFEIGQVEIHLYPLFETKMVKIRDNYCAIKDILSDQPAIKSSITPSIRVRSGFERQAGSGRFRQKGAYFKPESQKEIKMVKELYSLQDRVLARISKFADKHKFPFVLTGGTVLVRFNLKKEYRVSYDLDFFATAPVKFWPMRELATPLKKFCNE